MKPRHPFGKCGTWNFSKVARSWPCGHRITVERMRRNARIINFAHVVCPVCPPRKEK